MPITAKKGVTLGGGGFCADANVEINGAAFDTVASGATIDVPVIQDGAPVGSIVGSNFVIPPKLVRWFLWRNLTSYQTTTLTGTPTWDDITVTTEHPETEDIYLGTDYGSGILGNNSGRTVTGFLALDAQLAMSGTAQTVSFALAFWDGSSYVTDAGTSQALSLTGSTATADQCRHRLEWSGVELSSTGRVRIRARRDTGSGNLRTFGFTVRFVEDIV